MLLCVIVILVAWSMSQLLMAPLYNMDVTCIRHAKTPSDSNPCAFSDGQINSRKIQAANLWMGSVFCQAVFTVTMFVILILKSFFSVDKSQSKFEIDYD